MLAKKVWFRIELRDKSILVVEGNAVPTITGPIQQEPLSAQDLTFLQNIPADSFADTLPLNQGQAIPFLPEILLGQDFVWQMMAGMPEEIQELPSRGLYLIPSRLGYLLGGKATSAHSDLHVYCNNFHTLTGCSFDAASDRRIQDLFDMDFIGVKDDPKSTDDESAIEQFKASVQSVEKRISVSWPVNERISQLPSNYHLALRRFLSNGNKLKKTPKHLEDYNTVIQNQLKLNVIEVVDENRSCGSRSLLGSPCSPHA